MKQQLNGDEGTDMFGVPVAGTSVDGLTAAASTGGNNFLGASEDFGGFGEVEGSSTVAVADSMSVAMEPSMDAITGSFAAMNTVPLSVSAS